MSERSANTLQLKIISFVLTLTIFLLVTAEKETTRTYTLSVQPGEVAEGYVVTNELPDVELTLVGRTQKFASLDARDLQVLRLSQVQPGMESYRISELDFDSLPSGLRVRSISPQTIPIRMEPLVTRRVPIRINTRNRPPAGYHVVRMDVRPTEIEVTGPENELTNNVVFTENIDLSEVRGTLDRPASLQTRGSFITYDTDVEVRVVVQTEAQVETIVIEAVPIQLLGAVSEQRYLDHDTMALTLRGPQQVIEQIATESVVAAVDPQQLNFILPGTYQVEPQVQNVPAGVQIVSQIPRVVLLTIEGQAPDRLPEQPEPETPQPE